MLYFLSERPSNLPLDRYVESDPPANARGSFLVFTYLLRAIIPCVRVLFLMSGHDDPFPLQTAPLPAHATLACARRGRL